MWTRYRLYLSNHTNLPIDMTSTQPILITGAGCTGLVLALCLLKQGVPVRIIDKESGPRVGERGTGLMPRSLELHDYLGTYTDMMEYGVTGAFMKFYGPDGRTPIKVYPMFTPADPTPSIPHPNPVLVGQDYQEHILRIHVERLGGIVDYGTELRFFEDVNDGVVAKFVKIDASGVETEETAKFQYLVGADGAKSTVRKRLGAKFLGETKGEKNTMIVGDIFVESGLDDGESDGAKFWHAWGDMSKKMIILRRSGRVPGRYSTICGGPEIDHEKVAGSRESFIEMFYQHTGREDVKFGEFVWISKYRPNIRMVESFKFGRVFLAGDAAHCHSPTGGQGMNSSIQDSFNLAWKLALVIKGHASPSLLGSYNEERLPIIAEMLSITTKLLDKTFSTSDSKSDATWNRGGDLYQLGVNYRHSSIVVDQRQNGNSSNGSDKETNTNYHLGASTGLRAGDRAPDATGLTSISSDSKLTSDRLHKIIDVARHTVLFFQSGLDGSDLSNYVNLIESLENRQVLLKNVLILPAGAAPDMVVERAIFDVTLKDRDGHAYEGYGVAGGTTVVVIRPDAVVGAFVRDVSGLKTYFDKILNA